MVLYLELADLLAIATEALGLEVDAVLRITDLGLADSALARPKGGFGEEEFYPSLEAKAAALLDGILRNHPFVDGNKRLALLATLQFLHLNGKDLDLEPAKEAHDVIVRAAAGELDVPKLQEWIEGRIRPYEAE